VEVDQGPNWGCCAKEKKSTLHNHRCENLRSYLHTLSRLHETYFLTVSLIFHTPTDRKKTIPHDRGHLMAYGQITSAHKKLYRISLKNEIIWEDNIKIHLRKIRSESEDWIQMASSCEYGNEPSGSIKAKRIYWMTERLLISQEGYCSTQAGQFVHLLCWNTNRNSPVTCSFCALNLNNSLHIWF
jgi:hypothetical protein